jgi:hypothetical protein
MLSISINGHSIEHVDFSTYIKLWHNHNDKNRSAIKGCESSVRYVATRDNCGMFFYTDVHKKMKQQLFCIICKYNTKASVW